MPLSQPINIHLSKDQPSLFIISSTHSMDHSLLVLTPISTPKSKPLLMLEFFTEHLNPSQDASQMTESRRWGFVTGELFFSDVYYHVLTKHYNLLFSSKIKQMVDITWNSLSDGEKYEWHTLAKEVEGMYQYLGLVSLITEDQSAWFRSALRSLSDYLYSPCTLGVPSCSALASQNSESSFWEELDLDSASLASTSSTGYATSETYCLSESSTPFLSL